MPCSGATQRGTGCAGTDTEPSQVKLAPIRDSIHGVSQLVTPISVAVRKYPGSVCRQMTENSTLLMT
jgi:hypothetical protein